MRAYFLSEIDKAGRATSEIECRIRVVATARLLLQQIVFGLLEWLSKQSPDEDFQPDHKVLTSLHAPSDGTLVESLEILIICCERLGWTGVSRLLLQPIPSDRPSARLCGGQPQNIIGLLRALVALTGMISARCLHAGETWWRSLIALNELHPFCFAFCSVLFPLPSR
jgi:hypothetical protein